MDSGGFVGAFLASPVMRAALGPALLISLVTASMSVMVLAHRLSFLTVGISHATLAGLGLAALLALPLLPTATVVAVGVALLLLPGSGRLKLGEDAGTGLLFAGAMALGVVLVSAAGRYEVDLFGLLFGNILTVNAGERSWLATLAILIALALIFAARGWWRIAFDATGAAASGLPVGAYRLLLYGVVALTVVMCVKLAGIVLTTGLLILPAACASFWGRGLLGHWLLSCLFSVAGTTFGLMLSYARDWPSGATVVLTLCILFGLSWGGSWLKRHVQRQSGRGSSRA